MLILTAGMLAGYSHVIFLFFSRPFPLKSAVNLATDATEDLVSAGRAGRQSRAGFARGEGPRIHLLSVVW